MHYKIKSGAFVVAVLSLSMTSCNKSNPTNNPTNPAWQTVFSDDFNRADGSIGANYSVQIYPDTGQFAGIFSVSNNMARLSRGSFYAIRYVTGVANEVVKVSVKCRIAAAPVSSYGLGVTVKSRSLGDTTWRSQEMYSGYVWVNGFPASTYTDSTPDSSSGIYRVSGIGLPAPLISHAFVVKKGGSYLLELTASNNVLTFVATDLTSAFAETLSVTDAGTALTGTTVSINGMQNAGDTTYFDDFKIEKYE